MLVITDDTWGQSYRVDYFADKYREVLTALGYPELLKIRRTTTDIDELTPDEEAEENRWRDFRDEYI